MERNLCSCLSECFCTDEFAFVATAHNKSRTKTQHIKRQSGHILEIQSRSVVDVLCILLIIT